MIKVFHKGLNYVILMVGIGSRNDLAPIADAKPFREEMPKMKLIYSVISLRSSVDFTYSV